MREPAAVFAAKFAIRRTQTLRLSGSAIASTVRSRRERHSPVLVGIPKSALSIQGRLKTFHDTGESGQPVERNFCPECGSPIFSNLGDAGPRVHQSRHTR